MAREPQKNATLEECMSEAWRVTVGATNEEIVGNTGYMQKSTKEGLPVLMGGACRVQTDLSEETLAEAGGPEHEGLRVLGIPLHTVGRS